MAALDDVRERIREIDEGIVSLVAQRVEAAREAGAAKRSAHLPLRDYRTEREVVERLRKGFETQDLDPELGERVAQVLILEALRVQEADGLVPAEGERGGAVIVGGAGRMGRWFAHFMNALGYEITIADPAGKVDGFAHAEDAPRAARDAEVVVVATPPGVTAEVLRSLRGTDALVFDIASLKTPIVDTLVELAEDHRVTSVHPLWGPRTRVLSGKNLLVMHCGNAEAANEARKLFSLTAAHVQTLALDEHDPLMALTLGLPHLVNLAYAEVLSSSGHTFRELQAGGGPTFLKQTGVAAEVASEDPELYRQIQALNVAASETHDRLHQALDAVRTRVAQPDAFRAAMLAYRDYFGEAAPEVTP